MILHLSQKDLVYQKINGSIVLVGPAISEAHAAFRTQQDCPRALIVLIDSGEQPQKHIELEAIDISLDNIYVLWDAETKNTQIVIWNHANAWRKKQGLPVKEFYIPDDEMTMTDHGARQMDLSYKESSVRSLLDEVAVLGESALDHFFLWSESASAQESIATKLISKYPDSFRGFLRLSSITLPTRPKLTLLCLLQAANLEASSLPKMQKCLAKLRYTASWGQTLDGSERDTIPPKLRGLLLRPLKEQVRMLCSDVLWRYSAEKRNKVLYRDFSLPRFFSWLYPGRIAGMSHPKNEQTIDRLCEMGFTDVLTLSEESPVMAEWFEYKPIRSTVVPVANWHAPSLVEMDYIWSRIAAGGSWVIHCGGGIGRAGCVLACVMAMLGDEPDESEASEITVDMQPRLAAQTVIKLLREVRPSSLETVEQEQFVSSWISHRWKRTFEADAEVTSAEPIRIEKSARLPSFAFEKTSFLMLIGLPGSGKSWVASAIAKRRSKDTTIVISQDESGSRAACEAQISGKYKEGTLLILDRCNVEAADRKKWLSSCAQASKAVALNFEYSIDTCRARIDMRFDHPTIRAGRGRGALNDMKRLFQAANIEEGFAAVALIKSFSAAREAVRLIGGNLPIHKFPRTTHLLNLGAATADDLVNSSFKTISNNVSVEEKIDGANMGLSLDYEGRILCQNRGHYVNADDHAQFKALGPWLEQHTATLYELLYRDEQMPERYILFGEWCVARHSIAYTSLPDRFLAFDLYDRLTDTFVSRRILAGLLKGTGIAHVPLLFEGNHLTETDVMKLLETRSKYADGLIEGIYVRLEDEHRRKTIARGKIVRGEFTHGITEHWTKRDIEYNGFVLPEDTHTY